METLETIAPVWASYQPLEGIYDEFSSGHWDGFRAGLQALGPAEAQRRWEQVRQMVRENRVSYNMFSDGRTRMRPWPLDPFPLLVDSDEWARLSEGLAQRARLLNLILADLYGPQTLLARRLLPPELFLEQGGLLRPCHGIPLPHNVFLHFYGADLGRTPQGAWTVFRDRTQAPTGAGYALENRFIVSRSLPELFRDCNTARLGPLFRQWRDSLLAFAPRGRDNPRIVVLTPGPDHEGYFEDAYLSRYLGYSLVQGPDLTVRDGAVYLKTVSRLQPIDVIVRRIEDGVADPLELSGRSLVGVTGLLQAVRDQNVTVVNALGSGVLQSIAVMPYLPRLCQELLGEALKLESVPTWWLGEPANLALVENRLSRMVVKPVRRAGGRDPVFGNRLSRKQRQELMEAVRRHPWRYVAQEQVDFSTVPMLNGHRLEPRHVMLRTFAFASPQGAYTVLPGGMTRTSTAMRSLLVSVHQGGGSKDTWVVSREPHPQHTAWQTSPEHIELRRSDGDMPSRVADALYWLGRYIERSEHVARVLRCTLVRTMDRTDLDALAELPMLLAVLTAGHAPDLAADPSVPPWEKLQEELLAFGTQVRRSGSLRKWLGEIGRLSSRVRDRWSPDAWRVLTQLAGDMHATRVDSSRLLLMLNRLVLHLAAFSGLAYENTTRNLELRVLDIGRRIERALQMLEMLDRALGLVSDTESAVLEALLEVGDSAITYRQRYLTGLNGAAVLDLLLTDESNPRSVAFQLKILEKHIVRLPQNQDDPMLPPEQRVMVACLSEVRLTSVDHLYRETSEGRRPLLQKLCQRLLTNLPLLSEVISQRHFSHAPTPQALDLHPYAG